jgi:hypothetical protein
MSKRRLVCTSCNQPIALPRPVYLIDSETQAIRGPLHAMCAKHLKERNEVEYEAYKTHTRPVGTYLVGQPELPMSDEHAKWGKGGTEW